MLDGSIEKQRKSDKNLKIGEEVSPNKALLQSSIAKVASLLDNQINFYSEE